MGARVLVVDDDPAILRMFVRTFYAEGYEVVTAGDGAQALVRAEQDVPDLIVVDVVMPAMDGLAVVRRLREKGVWIPVLLVTARDAIADRVAGLDAGADDYLVKPFAADELLARLRALLRRGSTRDRHTYGDLWVDAKTRSAMRGDRKLQLTGREAALLELLVQRAGQVVSREQALAIVWGEGRMPTANTVDRYVAYLRVKLGDPPVIHTIRGVGFQLRQ